MLIALGAAGSLPLACHSSVVRRGEVDHRAVAAIGARISQIRGLPFLKPVRVRLSGPAELAHAALVEGDAFLAGFELGLGGGRPAGRAGPGPQGRAGRRARR